MFDIKMAQKIAKLSLIIYEVYTPMKKAIVDEGFGDEGKDWFYFERSDTQALLIHNGTEKEIYIIYRGTTSLKDWATNARMKKIETKWGGISRGILEAEDVTHDDITGILKAFYADGYKVFCGGHSLGGGIALRTAIRIEKELEIPVAGVYTFGCPQIFDIEGKKMYNQILGWKTYRGVHGLDMITFLPWQLHDTHVGVLVYMGKNDNIWVDELGHEEGRKRKRREQLMDGCQNACTFGLFRKGHSMERYSNSVAKGNVS